MSEPVYWNKAEVCNAAMRGAMSKGPVVVTVPGWVMAEMEVPRVVRRGVVVVEETSKRRVRTARWPELSVFVSRGRS